MNRRIKTILISLLMLPLTVSAQTNHQLEVGKNLDIFNALYSNLDLFYVDTLNPKQTMTAAIDGMLRSLDPYTEYYPEEETKNLKMMLTGKYAGIGALVKYHTRLKHVVIDEPYEGMPAAEVGLKKGDIILSIDDSVMTDKQVSYVSSHLRGDAGTTFVLKVKRPSTGKEMKFKITRRNIKLPELPYWGMRPDSIGYINLNQFTEGCAKSVRRAFVELKQQGAKGLVFDLRGNGGGYLAAAIQMINEFLPKNRLIVYTQGRRVKKEEYFSDGRGSYEDIPLIVLTDE